MWWGKESIKQNKKEAGMQRLEDKWQFSKVSPDFIHWENIWVKMKEMSELEDAWGKNAPSKGNSQCWGRNTSHGLLSARASSADVYVPSCCFVHIDFHWSPSMFLSPASLPKSGQLVLAKTGQAIHSKLEHNKGLTLAHACFWSELPCTALFQMANREPRLLLLCNSSISNMQSRKGDSVKMDLSLTTSDQQWHNIPINIPLVRISHMTSLLYPRAGKYRRHGYLMSTN